MKEGGYTTAFVGKWHGGARTPANLPINRGFDSHLGFLKGGEDHWNQGSGSANGEGGGTIDLWEGLKPSNQSGTYSGFLYTARAVKVIDEFGASLDAATGLAKVPGAAEKLFMYLAWHNTHTPLECPEEWMFPPLRLNNSQRNTYNCMARVLDDGIGNVTAALKKGHLWEETLMLFSADNGGWVGGTGSNNWPLRGSKVSDFEGGVRTVAFLAGGYLPPTVRGGTFTGLISIADWFGTLSELVGVAPHDHVAGLPPVDSVEGLWASLMVPNGTVSPRTELLLSYSCAADNGNASGCDPTAVSAYNTIDQAPQDPSLRIGGDMALISGSHKIIFGAQQGRGIWFGPVYPNGSHDQPLFPCTDGCLFDIFADPTEHVNLKESQLSLYETMRKRLLELGKTLYQTEYAEPGTCCKGCKNCERQPASAAGECLTGQQAREIYTAKDVHGSDKAFLGPMCFKQGQLPKVPPTPPPTPPGLSLKK
jgi:arylsulfatase I/J